MLFDDALRCRHRTLLERFSDFLLYCAQARLLARVDDGNRHAGFAGTSGASAAVRVCGGIVGQAVVDYVGQIVHVKTACCHVGGNEQLQGAFAEFLHHRVALHLRQVAVEGIDIVAVGNQIVGNLLSLAPGAAEDDSVDVGIGVGDTLEGKILVLGVHHIIYVAHILRALVACAYYKLLRVVHVVFRYFGDLVGHGG